ncbi:hypothetical protein FOFC_09182 [Fusarium oxysporum]|nr:hypothetical protein FOFC_09182 [Fusarium oxysporum]
MRERWCWGRGEKRRARYTRAWQKMQPTTRQALAYRRAESTKGRGLR